MTKGSVVQFPLDSQSSLSSNRGKPERVDLFGGNVEGLGKIAFIDVGTLTEAILLHIVVRNAVAAIIDLRPRPVFSRPRFHHKNVVTYFLQRDICYFEYALALQGEHRASGPLHQTANGLDHYIEEILQRGLTLLVYDDEAKERGWLDDVRYRLKRSGSFKAELNPRSLAGML